MGRFVKYFDIADGHNSVTIPQGTTADAPDNPEAGALRFNTSVNKLEFYNGTAWVSVSGSSTGSATITIDTFTILDEDSTGIPRDSYAPLSYTPTNPQNVLVFLGGVYQPPSAYTINSDSSADYIKLNNLVSGDISSSLVIIHGFDQV